MELINSATCNCCSDVLPAFSLDVQYALEGCRRSQPESQPLCAAFFFPKKMTLILFIQSFSHSSFLSPTSLLLLSPYSGSLLRNKPSNNKKKNLIFNKWLGFFWLEFSFPSRAGHRMMLPALSQCPWLALSGGFLSRTRLQVINIAGLRKPWRPVLIPVPWQGTDGRRMKR